MSRFLFFLAGALLGAIAGAALIFYFFVGAPRALDVPGAAIKAPDANEQSTRSAVVILRQEFFNQVLARIFTDLDAPTLPLEINSNDANGANSLTNLLLQASPNCKPQVVLQPTHNQIATQVSFDDNRIAAPLAFRGSVAVLGSCVEFSGWANSNLELRFDDKAKTVLAQIRVQTVNLDNVPTFAERFVTEYVQTSIDKRVNPIPVLRSDDIALRIPIEAANGSISAALADVRAEIKDNALHLHLIYDFSGARKQ